MSSSSASGSAARKLVSLAEQARHLQRPADPDDSDADEEMAAELQVSLKVFRQRKKIANQGANAILKPDERFLLGNLHHWFLCSLSCPGDKRASFCDLEASDKELVAKAIRQWQVHCELDGARTGQLLC